MKIKIIYLLGLHEAIYSLTVIVDRLKMFWIMRNYLRQRKGDPRRIGVNKHTEVDGKQTHRAASECIILSIQRIEAHMEREV